MNIDKNRLFAAAGSMLAIVVMAVISWMWLPDWVMVQLPSLQTGAPLLPKVVVMLFPIALTTMFAVLSFKKEEATKYSLLGHLFFVLVWICNL